LKRSSASEAASQRVRLHQSELLRNGNHRSFAGLSIPPTPTPPSPTTPRGLRHSALDGLESGRPAERCLPLAAGGHAPSYPMSSPAAAKRPDKLLSNVW